MFYLTRSFLGFSRVQVNEHLKITLTFIYHEIRRMARNLLAMPRRSASPPRHGIIRNLNEFRKTLFRAWHSGRAQGQFKR
jgi:hypothetical protein